MGEAEVMGLFRIELAEVLGSHALITVMSVTAYACNVFYIEWDRGKRK